MARTRPQNLPELLLCLPGPLPFTAPCPGSGPSATFSPRSKHSLPLGTPAVQARRSALSPQGKPDLNTALPVRQTASIFKQPVTKITNHPSNKVKSDPQKAVDQPRQVSPRGRVAAPGSTTPEGPCLLKYGRSQRFTAGESQCTTTKPRPL